MKNLIFLTFILILTSAAVFAQSQEPVLEIELSKESRGYQEFVRVTADSLYVLKNDRKGAGSAKNFSRKIAAEEWQNLVQLAQVIDFEEINALPSPTMNRAVDGAMHSMISIKTKGGEYYKHGFDDEHPHEVLQPLHQAIRDLHKQ